MTIDKSFNAVGLPRLPIDLREHKLSIGITWSVIVLSSCILPIVGYFALEYGTDLELNTVLSPWLGVTGATSLFSFCKRTYDLMKANSTCRPLGVEQGWKMDYFGWNFLFGFVGITILISVGLALESIVAVSLPLTVLLLYVCIELVVAQAVMALNIRAPIRFSSLERGGQQRPGTFIIVEDVVAVDGKQGRAWREAWIARYEASPVLRANLRRMDLLWGVSGLVIVAIVWGCVFGIDNHDVGYAIGWALPWIWAGLMTLLTIRMSKAMLAKEAGLRGSNASA